MSDKPEAAHVQPVRLADYRPTGLPDQLGPSRHQPRPQRDAGRLAPQPASQSGRSGRRAAGSRRRRPPARSRVQLDNEALDLAEVATPDRLTIANPPARPFTLEIETLLDPSANTRLEGPLSLRLGLLHPMRGRGLPPHHLLSRPPRRHERLHRADRGRQARGAGAARQRQSGRERRTGERPPLRGLA